jgi:hypothetical protein
MDWMVLPGFQGFSFIPGGYGSLPFGATVIKRCIK